jgi:adenosylcobinamide-GDP ribazoletransferase
MFKKFTTALQFLTIFTIRKDHQIEESDLAQAIPYFPIVGFLIGFVLVNADKLFAFAALPQSVSVFLLVILMVLITRAMHIDGLSDTFDGLMGGRDSESRLAIMRDSRIGAAGAIAIVCDLVFRYLCLNNLYETDRTVALLAVPVLGRWSQVYMVHNARYGREHGMGRAFVGHLRAGGFAGGTLLAVFLTAFVVLRLDTHTTLLFASLVFAVVAFTALAKRYLVKRLNGVTGDAIGAVSELNEGLALLIFVFFANGN